MLSPPENPGDLNGDRVVNVDDLTLITSQFGKDNSDPNWDARADADNNQVINVEDLTVVTSSFGNQY